MVERKGIENDPETPYFVASAETNIGPYPQTYPQKTSPSPAPVARPRRVHEGSWAGECRAMCAGQSTILYGSWRSFPTLSHAK